KASTIALYDHRRTIAQHFGDAVHDFGRVVVNADDRIRTHLLRMLQHELEGLAARPFAEAREQRNIAADQSLERAADAAEDRPRANHDAAHDAESADDPVAFQGESGCRERVFHGISSVVTVLKTGSEERPPRRNALDALEGDQHVPIAGAT